MAYAKAIVDFSRYADGELQAPSKKIHDNLVANAATNDIAPTVVVHPALLVLISSSLGFGKTNGNPSAKNLFGVLAHLQAQEGVNFEIRPRRS